MRKDGRTDGETGMKKLIITFRNFANAPKNEPKDSNSKDLVHVAQ